MADFRPALRGGTYAQMIVSPFLYKSKQHKAQNKTDRPKTSAGFVFYTEIAVKSTIKAGSFINLKRI